MKNKLLVYEIIGMVFSIFFGSILHFAFQWSGNSKIVALVAAVNESTWEHLKLGFWPLLAWAIFEYSIFKKKSRNFIAAKGLSLLSFCFLIPLIFYSYQAILGKHFLILDILTFIISVIIAQLLSYRMITAEKDLKLENLGAFLIIALLLAFLSFSFFPPKNFLFKEPVTGGYGIVND
jgi:hypothetical protein